MTTTKEAVKSKIKHHVFSDGQITVNTSEPEIGEEISIWFPEVYYDKEDKFSNVEFNLNKDDAIAICNHFELLPETEQYVKETKMEEPKYKYVDAGIKDLGGLVNALNEGEIIFNGDCELEITGYLNVVNKGFSSNYNIPELVEIIPDLTHRQPIPWYEVEGVFPCLVKFKSGSRFIAYSYDNDRNEVDLAGHEPTKVTMVTPLTPSEAATLGFEY